MAATVDASQVFSGIDVSTVVGAISAAGAIMVTVVWVYWAIPIVGCFFEELEAIYTYHRYGDE